MSTPAEQLRPQPEREMTFDELVDFVGREYRVPKGLRHSLFTQESSKNPNVRDSSAGAQGPGQLMPATARQVGVNPRDPVENVVGSVHYLRSLYDKARPQSADDAEAWAKAVGGYFSGPGNMGAKPGHVFRRDKADTDGTRTSQYVTGVLSKWADYDGPDNDWDESPTSIPPSQSEAAPPQATPQTSPSSAQSLLTQTPPNRERNMPVPDFGVARMRSRVQPVVAGNIDLTKRPVVKNPDGSISTIRSISVNIDGREVLIPTVSDDGKVLTDRQAVDLFKRTGKHLGMFDSPEAATTYAERLHQQQAEMYAPPTGYVSEEGERAEDFADVRPQARQSPSLYTVEGRRLRDLKIEAEAKGGTYRIPIGDAHNPEDAAKAMAVHLSQAADIPEPFVADWLARRGAGLYDAEGKPLSSTSAGFVLLPAEAVGRLRSDYKASLFLPSRAARNVSEAFTNYTPGEHLAGVAGELYSHVKADPVELKPEDKAELEATQASINRGEYGGQYKRAFAQPFEGFSANLGAMAGNVVNVLGRELGVDAVRDVGAYLQRRGAVTQAKSQMRPEGEEMEYGPEAVRYATGAGLSIAQLVLTRRVTGLPLPAIMAGESLVRDADKPPAVRAQNAITAFGSGLLLEGTLGKPTGRGVGEYLRAAAPGTIAQAGLDVGQATLEHYRDPQQTPWPTVVARGAGGALLGLAMGGKPEGEQARLSEAIKPEGDTRVLGDLTRRTVPESTLESLPDIPVNEGFHRPRVVRDGEVIGARDGSPAATLSAEATTAFDADGNVLVKRQPRRFGRAKYDPSHTVPLMDGVRVTPYELTPEQARERDPDEYLLGITPQGEERWVRLADIVNPAEAERRRDPRHVEAVEALRALQSDEADESDAAQERFHRGVADLVLDPSAQIDPSSPAWASANDLWRGYYAERFPDLAAKYAGTEATLESETPHHSHFQPRDEAGHFDGPPQIPEGVDAGTGRSGTGDVEEVRGAVINPDEARTRNAEPDEASAGGRGGVVLPPGEADRGTASRIVAGGAEPLRGTSEVGESQGASPLKVQLRDEVVGAHHGQVDGWITAQAEDGRIVGRLKYSLFRGDAHIDIVEAAPEARRQGIGSKLVRELQEQNPNATLKWGMMTPEGTQLRRAYEARYPNFEGLKQSLSAQHPNVTFTLTEAHGKVELRDIRLPMDERNRGAGTAFMRDLVRYADDNGKTVTVTPARKGDYGDNAISHSRLIDFYKRFGFVENKGRNKDYSISDSMIRRPQKAKAKDANNVATESRGGTAISEPKLLPRQIRPHSEESTPTSAESVASEVRTGVSTPEALPPAPSQGEVADQLHPSDAAKLFDPSVRLLRHDGSGDSADPWGSIGRESFRSGLRHAIPTLSDAQADAALLTVEARARAWAKEHGRSPAEYVPSRFAGFGRGGEAGPGSLNQGGGRMPRMSSDRPEVSGQEEGAANGPNETSGRRAISTPPHEVPLVDFRPTQARVIRNPKRGWDEPAHITENQDPRETNWKAGDEGYFYRAGALPKSGRSRDYRDNLELSGVSVYPLPNPYSFAGLKEADWYTGRGRIIGTGSDGEPLIKPIGKWEKFHDAGGEDLARDAHRFYVEKALKEGRPVAAEVIADYPDLQAKYASKPTDAPTSAAQSPDILRQQNKAAVEFLRDNRAILRGLSKPDISSAWHEMAHVFRRDLSPELLRDAEEALGVKNGVWENTHEESFARGFERYLKTGVSPSEKLRRVFESAKQWLTEIYGAIRGKDHPLKFKPNEKLTAVFDRMLDAAPKGEHGKLVNELYKSDFVNSPQVKPALGLKADASADDVRWALAGAVGKPRSSHITPEDLTKWADLKHLQGDARTAMDAAIAKYQTNGEVTPTVEEAPAPIDNLIDSNVKLLEDFYEGRIDEGRFTREATAAGLHPTEIRGVIEDASAYRAAKNDRGAGAQGGPSGAVQRTGDTGRVGEGDVSPAFRISKARYAKGSVAVRPTRQGEYKGRAGRLAEAVGGRYSSREDAYIMSEAKGRRLQKLYDEGWDTHPFTGVLEPPKITPQGSPKQGDTLYQSANPVPSPIAQRAREAARKGADAYRKRLESSIADYERRIAEGDLSTKRRGAQPVSEDVAALRAKRDELRKELETLRRSQPVQGPKLTDAPKLGPAMRPARIEGPRLGEGTGRAQGPKLSEGFGTPEGPSLDEGIGPLEGPRQNTPWHRVLTAFRRANLLSSPKTHGRNIISNVAFQGSEEASKPFAVLADALISRKTGRRTVAGPSIASVARASKAAVVKGIPEAWNIIRHGNPEGAKLQLEEIQTRFPILDAYINHSFRTLGAEDHVFKTYAVRRSLEEQARVQAMNEKRTDRSVNISARQKELLENPTAEMQAEAVAYAEFATFQNENAISDTISKLKNKSEVGKFAFEQLVPFDKTPTNIMLRVLDYSPAGLAKAGIQYGRARRRAAQNLTSFMSEAEQKQFAQTFGRGTLGTGVLMLGAVLASKGLLAGDTDYKDDQKTYSERRRLGILPGSLKIGNTRIVVSGNPLGNVLKLGATIYEQATRFVPEEARKEGRALDVRATRAGKALFGAVADQPLLRFAADAESDKSLGQRAGEFLSGYVPLSAAVNEAGEVLDPKQRQARGFVQSMQRRVPLWREQLKEQENPLGGKRGKGGLGRRLLRALDPLQTTTQTGREGTRR